MYLNNGDEYLGKWFEEVESDNNKVLYETLLVFVFYSETVLTF
jgi:hypothetical protein